eukprot:Em0013g18a
MQAPYGPTSHTQADPPGHMPSRQVETIVTPSAKAYVASEHVSQLAQAKKHVDGPFREPQWVISPGTLQAVPTERVLQLGKPRKYPDGYQPCREVIWKVTNGAMNAVPSTRMCDLSSLLSERQWIVSSSIPMHLLSARGQERPRPLKG